MVGGTLLNKDSRDKISLTSMCGLISLGSVWGFAFVVHSWGGDWGKASWMETGIRWKIWIPYKRPAPGNIHFTKPRLSARIDKCTTGPDLNPPLPHDWIADKNREALTRYLQLSVYLQEEIVSHPTWSTLSWGCFHWLCWDLSVHR